MNATSADIMLHFWNYPVAKELHCLWNGTLKKSKLLPESLTYLLSIKVGMSGMSVIPTLMENSFENCPFLSGSQLTHKPVTYNRTQTFNFCDFFFYLVCQAGWLHCPLPQATGGNFREQRCSCVWKETFIAGTEEMQRRIGLTLYEQKLSLSVRYALLSKRGNCCVEAAQKECCI